MNWLFQRAFGVFLGGVVLLKIFANLLARVTVSVVVFGSRDELDIEEALIESNRQREKTGEMIGREYIELKRIYNERDSRQGANQYTSQPTAAPAVIQPNEAKTPEQIGREHIAMRDEYDESKIKNNRASVRIRTEAKPENSAPKPVASKPKDLAPTARAAKAIGVTKDTANKAASVVNVIDRPHRWLVVQS